jgi:hypothetical protein
MKAVVKVPTDELRSDYLAGGLLHDYEATLVHELLHCVLDFPCYQVHSGSSNYRWAIPSVENEVYEQRINTLAHALVTVDRMHSPTPHHATILSPEKRDSLKVVMSFAKGVTEEQVKEMISKVQVAGTVEWLP